MILLMELKRKNKNIMIIKIKKIIIFNLIFFAFTFQTSASEIFGKISTNPKVIPVFDKPVVDEKESENNEIKISQPNSWFPISVQNNNIIKKSEQDAEIIVLGLKYYPDHTLLRGPDKKIYITEGQVKKHIINLAELQKYFGVKIIEVSEGDLLNYQTRPHLNGTLVREKDTKRIFVLDNQSKKRIFSLQELRRNYFAKPIYDLDPQELALYPDYIFSK